MNNNKFPYLNRNEIILLVIFYLVSSIFIYLSNNNTKYLKTLITRGNVFQANYCSGSNAFNKISIGSQKIHNILADKVITENSLAEIQKLKSVNTSDELIEITVQLKGTNNINIENYEKLLKVKFDEYYKNEFNGIYEVIKLHCLSNTYSMYKVANNSQIVSSVFQYKYTKLTLIFLGTLPTLIILLLFFIYRIIRIGRKD